MSDSPHATTPPPQEAGEEYGFSPRANPLSTDEEQREASKYGLYGHQAASGRAYEGQEGESHSAAPDAPPPPDPGIPESTLPQPNEYPQRAVTSEPPVADDDSPA